MAYGVVDQSEESIESHDSHTGNPAAIYGKYLNQLLLSSNEDAHYPALDVLRADPPLLAVSLRCLLQLRDAEQQLVTPHGDPV